MAADRSPSHGTDIGGPNAHPGQLWASEPPSNQPSVGVTFFGVRGSTPSPSQDLVGYGGNTSCVALTFSDPGQPGDSLLDHPIVFFDLGTGARVLGHAALRPDQSFDGTCLLTHSHWDHIQGLPFFPPLLRGDDDRLTVMAPRCRNGRTIAQVVSTVMRPPVFPVGVDDLPGTIVWSDVDEGRRELADASVLARVVPHTDRTMGYRLEYRGIVVTYIPDHQQPPDERGGAGSHHVSDAVLALASDADLLIFDSQYTDAEFERKVDWGHSTPGYAGRVATKAKARHLVLFHHDPSHDDATVDRLTNETQANFPDLVVSAATEGHTIWVVAQR